MKKENLLLIVFPFLLSAGIIFGHYNLLRSQNLNAHSVPLITTDKVENLNEKDLIPVSPTKPFPNQVKGIVSDIPTSKGKVTELLELAQSQQANTLLLKVGITLSEDSGIIIPQATQSSKETLLRWAKKTISSAHQQGIHTYLAIIFIEEPQITNVVKFNEELQTMISQWAKMAEEFHVSFFNPGITVGHPSFQSIPSDQLQTLLKMTERKSREYYTGRIGIGVCCNSTSLNLTGYNQILFMGTGDLTASPLLTKNKQDALKFGIEHLYFLNQANRSLIIIQ